MNTDKKVLHWFANGNTGISSKALALHLSGVEPKDKYTPSDPSDFNQCLLMLKAVPEFKDRLDEARSISKHWDKIIDKWSEIEASFISEVGFNWENGRRAPETYNLMKSILND